VRDEDLVPSNRCSDVERVDRFGSRWFVGSSRTSTFGFCSMIRQKGAVSPPDSASVGYKRLPLQRASDRAGVDVCRAASGIER
jgi:hypothetical protein